MRALLVVNPAATAPTGRTRDAAIRASRGEVDLDVAYTGRTRWPSGRCG